MNPVIAITMGDPAGIGPEVILKAFRNLDFPLDFTLFVIGNESILAQEAERNAISITVKPISDITSLVNTRDEIPVVSVPFAGKTQIQYGTLDATYGDISFQSVISGIKMGMDKQIDAIVTAPISKEAWHMAGHTYDGHTGLLAEKSNTIDYRMMFASSHLNVILATTHMSLSNACSSLSTQRVVKTIQLGADYLKKIAHPSAKIAVCGLNPHASENGIFGEDEARVITPAIEEARRLGISVQGPFPSDTIFLRALKKEFDMVVAMYHDQGLIPIKLVAFEEAVNITLGLPFVRTSVDHGTAFDIAGKGQADYRNMIAAIHQAASLSK